MPGKNLTRREALARSGHITVRSYAIDIDVRDALTSPTFRTITKITFVSEGEKETFVDAIASAVHSITLNGESLNPEDVFADSRISLTFCRLFSTDVRLFSDWFLWHRLGHAELPRARGPPD